VSAGAPLRHQADRLRAGQPAISSAQGAGGVDEQRCRKLTSRGLHRQCSRIAAQRTHLGIADQHASRARQPAQESLMQGMHVDVLASGSSRPPATDQARSTQPRTHLPDHQARLSNQRRTLFHARAAARQLLDASDQQRAARRKQRPSMQTRRRLGEKTLAGARQRAHHRVAVGSVNSAAERPVV